MDDNGKEWINKCDSVTPSQVDQDKNISIQEKETREETIIPCKEVLTNKQSDSLSENNYQQHEIECHCSTRDQ